MDEWPNDQRNRAATVRFDFKLRVIRRSGSRNCSAFAYERPAISILIVRWLQRGQGKGIFVHDPRESNLPPPH